MQIKINQNWKHIPDNRQDGVAVLLAAIQWQGGHLTSVDDLLWDSFLWKEAN